MLKCKIQLPFCIFIRIRLRTKVPKNKNTAKTTQALTCIGFGSDLSLARLARYVPRKLHAAANKPPIVPRITA